MSRRQSTGNPTGRPTTYTLELADAVLELIMEGSDVAEACRKAGVRPQTFRGWMDTIGGLYDRYERAQIIRGLMWEDSLLELVDDPNVPLAKISSEIKRCDRHCKQWPPRRF
jgi:hypothetical protein